MCTGCGKNKNIEDFYKDSSKKTGLHTRCKSCFLKSIASYRKTKRYLEVRRKYGKTKIAIEYRKKYTKTNKLKEYRRAYSKTDEYRERRRQYYSSSDKVRNYNREYKKSEKNKIWRREYSRKRRLDPRFRLDTNVGIAICEALCGEKRWRRWCSLVGYTLEDLVAHLEKQFDTNMSWDNYGSYWHVDHIRPKSLFLYTSSEDEEFKKCWSLDNLQPMEKMENIRKSNKYPYLTNDKQEL